MVLKTFFLTCGVQASPVLFYDENSLYSEGCDLVVSQVSHLITGCHLCMGYTPRNSNAEEQSQYNLVERDIKP